jgi:Ankyrin repeats (3 copies)
MRNRSMTDMDGSGMLTRSKRRKMEERESDNEEIADRTLLVLYFTCVRHPYLYPELRRLCKVLRDDAELEIEYYRFTNLKERSKYGMEYVLGRLLKYVDSFSTLTLLDHIIELIEHKKLCGSNYQGKLISSLLNKMKESEKHKYAFEKKVEFHYHSVDSYNCALKWAARRGNFDLVRLLLADPHVDPSAWNQSAIRVASMFGRTEIVRTLLAHPRVDPSVDNQCAFRTASANGHKVTVRLLLADTRVDPSANNQEAIGMAREYGRAGTIQPLVADPCVVQ